MDNGERIKVNTGEDLGNYTPERDHGSIGEKAIFSTENEPENAPDTPRMPEFEIVTVSEASPASEAPVAFNPNDKPEQKAEAIMRLDNPSEMMREFQIARKGEK